MSSWAFGHRYGIGQAIFFNDQSWHFLNILSIPILRIGSSHPWLKCSAISIQLYCLWNKKKRVVFFFITVLTAFCFFKKKVKPEVSKVFLSEWVPAVIQQLQEIYNYSMFMLEKMPLFVHSPSGLWPYVWWFIVSRPLYTSLCPFCELLSLLERYMWKQPP